MNMRDQIPDAAVQRFCKEWERLVRRPPLRDVSRILFHNGYIPASRDRLIRKYARSFA